MDSRKFLDAILPAFRRRSRTGLLALLGVFACMFAAGQALAAERGYRLFISVDMEGIGGVVSDKQLSAGAADYQASRKLMTDELLAAIEGARKGGATEFVVADSHGDGQNLLVELLPPDVTLIRGLPRPLQMLEGIQNGRFDGVMFIGYHAGAASARGVRAHTISSSRISNIALNGVSASEGYLNAAFAGELGVPVILVSGDQATIDEMAPVKGFEPVVVKRDISFHSAEVMAPIKAQQLISAAAARAVQGIGKAKPFKIATPVKVELTFHFYRPAEVLAWLPSIKRTGGRSVEFQAENAEAAVRFVSFATTYNAALEP